MQVLLFFSMQERKIFIRHFKYIFSPRSRRAARIRAERTTGKKNFHLN